MKHGSPNTYKNGCRCDECRNANRLKNEKRRKNRLRFPVEPLLLHMPADFSSNHKRAIAAWSQKGLTIFEVDRICTKYGVHPFAVYGTYWYSDMWVDVA